MKIGQTVRCKSGSLQGVVCNIADDKAAVRAATGKVHIRKIAELVVSHHRRVDYVQRELDEAERKLRAIVELCWRYTHPGVTTSTSLLAERIIEMSKGEQ